MTNFIELYTASFCKPMLVNLRQVLWVKPHDTQRDWCEIAFVGEDSAETFAIPYIHLCNKLLENEAKRDD